MLKEYYGLAKPGIVYGNALTAAASFLFASRWHFATGLFLATLVGISLVIASACAFNNYVDCGIDRKMERTRDRALPKGRIPARYALIYGSVLGLAGFALLWMYANPLAAGVALIGFIFYVVLYAVAKRRSHWGTVVGSVSGATPIVVGYVAVTDRLDVVALVLFLILVLWQMPHFYAIAIRRMDDYRAAGIPVLPLRKGIPATKRHVAFYLAAFLVAACLPAVFGYAGYIYLALMALLSFWWLWLGFWGFRATDDARWARTLFLFSLVVIVSFSALLSVAPVLP